ncbi:MAG TPA: hypothetical protein VFF06_33425 [Polyangia bacterium]|nr:hypothetical protein [Polyangia bacterium]
MKGIAGFVRFLVRAPKAQARLIGAIMLGSAIGGYLLGGPLGVPPLAFAGFALIVSLLPAYAILNRAAGPGKSYSLFVPATAPQAGGYRSADALTVAPLVERLAKLGYRLEVALVDSSGRPAAAAPESTPLLGPALELRQAGARRGTGHVALRLPERGGMGSVDVVDTPHGPHGELALYLILAVGELVRGAQFKETFSSLSPESTEWLRPQLPDAPRALRR